MTAFDDAAYDRIHFIRVHIANGDSAFGHPRALIQLCRQVRKGAEVNLDQLCAKRAPLLERCLIGCLHLRVVEELGIGRYGQFRPDRQADRRATGVGAAVGVAGIEAAGDGGDCLGVGNSQGEYRDAIEGSAGRYQSGIGQPAAGRFETDDIVEAGRHAAGPGGVGAERKGYQTTGDHTGGAGAGAAADVTGVEAVADGAIRGTGADQAGGELVQIGLANQNGSCRAQAGNDGGIGTSLVSEGRAGGSGVPASCVDVVLYREGDAVQWQRCDVAFHLLQALIQSG